MKKMYFLISVLMLGFAVTGWAVSETAPAASTTTTTTTTIHTDELTYADFLRSSQKPPVAWERYITYKYGFQTSPSPELRSYPNEMNAVEVEESAFVSPGKPAADDVNIGETRELEAEERRIETETVTPQRTEVVEVDSDVPDQRYERVDAVTV